MMKHCFSIMVSLMVVIPTFAQHVRDKEWGFHRELLKNKFDTSYWKNAWEDELWCIRCIFVDMEGDGKEELIAATTSDEEDRTGWVWKIYRKEKGCGFKQMMRRRDSTDIFFLCHWDSFYKVSYSDRADAVVGLGMNANIKEPCGNGERRIVRATPDCKFVVVPENKFMLREIQPDVDTSFRRKDVVSIERLYPEWYFGFDFRPPPDVPHCPVTLRPPYRQPKGDLRRGGGMIAADDFAVFVEEYRRKVKMKTGDKSKVSVYAVHLDADNDGDADCYVSSDAERTDDGKFSWTLFLRNGEKLSRASESVYPVESRRELCRLNSQVSASKDSFCRIIRFDVDPLFMVLDDSIGKTAIRDTITEYDTHRIEKLVCVEHPEK